MIELTPLDVRSKKGDFRRGLRGYETPQVDDFLDIVADRLEALVRENLTLSERVARIEQQLAQYKGQERALTDSLLSAQAMREQIRGEAVRESDELRKVAQSEVERLRAEAERVAQREEETIRAVRTRRIAFLAGYRAFLEKEIKELTTYERAADAEAEQAREETGPAASTALPPAAAVKAPQLPAAPPPPATTQSAAVEDIDARLGEMLSEWTPGDDDDVPAIEVLDELEPLAADESEAEADAIDELAELEALIASASQSEDSVPPTRSFDEEAAPSRPAFLTGSDPEIEAIADRMFSELDGSFEIESVVDEVEQDNETSFELSADDVVETPESLESELWLEEETADNTESILDDVEPFNPFAALPESTYSAEEQPVEEVDAWRSEQPSSEDSFDAVQSSGFEQDGAPSDTPATAWQGDSQEEPESRFDAEVETGEEPAFEASVDELFGGFDDTPSSWSQNGAGLHGPGSNNGARDEDIRAAFGDHGAGHDGLLDIRGFTTENGQPEHDEEDGEFDANFGLTLRPDFGEGEAPPAEELDSDGSTTDNTRDFFSVPRDEE